MRTTHWGDRTLDLDLIDYGGQVSADDAARCCRTRAPRARFVLQPWLDVDPDAVLPGRGSVADLRRAATDEVVRR